MPINTGGYALDRYTTPVATPLAQSDPQAVNNGILSQFTVATEAEKLAAFKMLQEENRALHEDRLAEGHSRLQDLSQAAESRMQLRPTVTENALYDAKTTALSNPQTRQLALSDLNQKVILQPTRQDTEAQVVQQANELAPGAKEVALNEQKAASIKAEGAVHRADLENETAQAKAILANADTAFQADTQDMVQATKLAQIRDQYEHADNDVTKGRLLNDLKIETEKADIALKNAQAKFALGEGRQTAVGRDKTIADIAQLNRAEDSILKQIITVDGRPMSVEVYRSQRNPADRSTINITGEEAVKKLGHIQELLNDSLAESMDAKKKAKEAQAAIANPPVTVHYNPAARSSLTAPVATQVPDSAYDVPATEQAAVGQPQVKYDEHGNAWTLDSQGNVVPYKP